MRRAAGCCVRRFLVAERVEAPWLCRAVAILIWLFFDVPMSEALVGIGL